MARVLLASQDDVAEAMPLLEMWLGQNKRELSAEVKKADQYLFDRLPLDFRRALNESPIEVTAASVHRCIHKYGEAAAFVALRRQLAEWLEVFSR